MPTNAFSKSGRGTSFSDFGSASVDMMDVNRSVVVEKDGVPTTFIESKRVKVSEYAESLGLPKDEQYQLRDMLKSGYIPEEVNVHGMLDNPDPSDTSVRDALVDRLFAIGDKSSKPAAKPDVAAIEKAAAVASSTVETIKND